MKKQISIFVSILILALLQARLRLWSGYAPDLLLLGLFALAGYLSILWLLFLTLFGFVFLAGPALSPELLTTVVIVALIHGLRLSFLGKSTLWMPVLGVTGVLVFYLILTGGAIFTTPWLLVEIVFLSLLVSLVFHFLVVYF